MDAGYGTNKATVMRESPSGWSCKVNKCSDAGTGYLGVLATHEASSIEMVMSAQPIPVAPSLKRTWYLLMIS